MWQDHKHTYRVQTLVTDLGFWWTWRVSLECEPHTKFKLQNLLFCKSVRWQHMHKTLSRGLGAVRGTEYY